MPRVRSVPGTATWSAADDVLLICETAVHLGGTLTLMPWQEQLLTDILSVRPDGKWAARDAAYLVARQNGKGGVLHALELAGLFLFDDVHEILHSAHEVKTAKKAFRELKEIIKNTPHLYAKVERRGNRVVGFRHSNEDVSITVVDDQDRKSVVRFIARATNTGRGFSPQWLIIDEAQICNEEAREAIFYSTRAQANPLRVWCGTAPKPSDPSDVFTALRDRGRAGGDSHMSWAEWSVDPDVAIEELREPAAYAAAVVGSNPALGVLLDWETADSERAAAVSDEAWEGLCREALSWWPDKSSGDIWGVIDRTTFHARFTTADNPDAPGRRDGPVTLAVEADQSLTRTCIAVAGTRPDRIGAAVVLDHPGTAGVVDLIVAQVLPADGTKPVAHVVIDSRSPASLFIEPLEAAGVTVTSPKTGEVTTATSTLRTLFTDDGIEIRPSDELTRAAAVAKLRKAGESQAIDRWADQDAVPLIGLNLAVWGHQNQPETDGPSIYETRGLVEL